MAYRRLPNTDKARIRALKAVLSKCAAVSYPSGPLKSTVLSEVNQTLYEFEMAVERYENCYGKQIVQGREVRNKVKQARLYLSHFIQVLNLSVVRGEIRKKQRELYGLPVDSAQTPDLSTDKRVFVWGKKVLDGERLRTQSGGIPIYNPTIARVKVFYDQFSVEYVEHQHMQELTLRQSDLISSLRPKVDKLIREVWNAVELWIGDLVFIEKVAIAKEYGIIYYSRNKQNE